MGIRKTILEYIYKKQSPITIICPSFLNLIGKIKFQEWQNVIKEYDIQILLKGGSLIKQKTIILIIPDELATKQIDLLQIQRCMLSQCLLKRDGKISQPLIGILLKMMEKSDNFNWYSCIRQSQIILQFAVNYTTRYFLQFQRIRNMLLESEKNPWSNTIQYDGNKNHSYLYYLQFDQNKYQQICMKIRQKF